MSKRNPVPGDVHYDYCPYCGKTKFEVKEIDSDGDPIVKCQSCHKLFAVIAYQSEEK